MVGGAGVELGQGVVVVGAPAERTLLVCFSGPGCHYTGHNFGDGGWTVCGENGLHGGCVAKLAESVYFGWGEAG